MSAEAPPAADGAPAHSVTEGRATIYFDRANEVFYNKVQCLNRDLSVLMLRLFVAKRKEEHAARAAKKGRQPGPLRGIRIAEPLAASGLRSIRYAKEVPDAPDDVDSVIVNDIDAAAVEAIRRNVRLNGLEAGGKMQPSQSDASALLYQRRDLDVVDLDPYGSAAPFIDAAVQSVADGGLLAVTCTDGIVLCGNRAELCLSRYGAAPVRGEVCHEAGVRILVASIARQAARYHRTVVPVLSASINFYFRVFLRVHDSPAEVTRLGTRLAHVYKCVYCSVFYTQPLLDAQPRGGGVHYQAPHAPPSGGLCGECGSRLRMGGPLWTAPLHDREWLDRALAALRAEPQRFATRGAMEALLTLLRDELPDAPLFYSMPELCRALRLRPVKTVLVRSALLNAGFRVSQAHTSPTAVKTDAPAAAVMDVMRCLVQRGLTATSAGKPPRGARPRAAAAAAAAAGAAAPAAPKAAAAGEGAQEEEEDEEAAAQQAQQAEEAARLSPAATVFARPPRLAADFSERADAHVDDGVPRFLPNPEENWGPKARATGKREPPRADAHAHAHAEGKRPRPEGRAPAASAASASASSSSSAPRH